MDQSAPHQQVQHQQQAASPPLTGVVGLLRKHEATDAAVLEVFAPNGEHQRSQPLPASTDLREVTCAHHDPPLTTLLVPPTYVPFFAAHLRVLNLSSNGLTSLPLTLWSLTELRELNVGHNRLTRLSPMVACLANLEELHLAGNALTTLPCSLVRCTQLAVLDVSENQLAAVPATLLGMRSLRRLWVDGNPFTSSLGPFAATAGAAAVTAPIPLDSQQAAAMEPAAVRRILQPIANPPSLRTMALQATAAALRARGLHAFCRHPRGVQVPSHRRVTRHVVAELQAAGAPRAVIEHWLAQVSDHHHHHHHAGGGRGGSGGSSKPHETHWASSDDEADDDDSGDADQSPAAMVARRIADWADAVDLATGDVTWKCDPYCGEPTARAVASRIARRPGSGVDVDYARTVWAKVRDHVGAVLAHHHDDVNERAAAADDVSVDELSPLPMSASSDDDDRSRDHGNRDQDDSDTFDSSRSLFSPPPAPSRKSGRGSPTRVSFGRIHAISTPAIAPAGKGAPAAVSPSASTMSTWHSASTTTGIDQAMSPPPAHGQTSTPGTAAVRAGMARTRPRATMQLHVATSAGSGSSTSSMSMSSQLIPSLSPTMRRGSAAASQPLCAGMPPATPRAASLPTPLAQLPSPASTSSTLGSTASSFASMSIPSPPSAYAHYCVFQILPTPLLLALTVPRGTCGSCKGGIYRWSPQDEDADAITFTAVQACVGNFVPVAWDLCSIRCWLRVCTAVWGGVPGGRAAAATMGRIRPGSYSRSFGAVSAARRAGSL
ncbi:hypothetical protein H9P43_001380 [Blastocladiella emersonii ATCC 22665]|nr:hypothetical protein H9P43_001380 [Blastocladiella emersonii ATCC 22665]